MKHHSLLIIGSGPAGYTAAIYAGRAGLEPVIVEGMQPGGQLTITTEVENFPGFPQGIDANQLMMDMRTQAERFGAKIISGTITRTDLSQAPYRLWTDSGDELTADSIIIATGASAKYLGLDDEQKYMG
ncbi:MAG: FAD-dependent oxidoreductase, partial [Bacteroidaceae bacterium]|nr:FAD-dependent oxidoreductase [Bacteroidaceae bacterium]